jgi:tellurite resistance protein
MLARMAAAKTNATLALIEKHADALRKELHVPKQNEVFACAVEAGYLAALADGTIDPSERAAIVRAAELLSVGAVIEWEAEALLDACAERADKEGAAMRAEAVGAELKKLGQAEAGLLFAAVVARASKGVDKKEADVLKAVATAAGVTSDAVAAIVKKAGAIS